MTRPEETGELARLVADGDECRRRGELAGAAERYRRAATSVELPAGAVWVRLARVLDELGEREEALRATLAVVDADDDIGAWSAAAALLEGMDAPLLEHAPRSLRVAVLGSATTAYYVSFLRLAARRRGLHLVLYEGPYGQYQQELLDPGSGVHGFAPDVVVLAVHTGDLQLPWIADAPDDAVRDEVDRWRGLWARAEALGAAVVQHNFVVPGEVALGHLAAALPGSRHRMLQELNLRLAEALPSGSYVVDCERLAGQMGKGAWHDPVLWDRAKLPVALAALPTLARHAAAVLAAHAGLGRKCLVVDLDNTIWGGVIGEDGLAGIRLGAGDPVGEAFGAVQEYLLELRRRGVVLAACSKNDDAVARAPFEHHPEMRLRLDDFAVFVANWRSKVDNIVGIAADLGLGVDALAYLDDNPVERAEVRRFLPEVDVISLPAQPSLYTRTLAAYPYFEASSFTLEDAQRTAQYRARAEAQLLERTAESVDEFLESLEMTAVVAPFSEMDLVRVAQLVGKTNQFNLTALRLDVGELRAAMEDPNCVHLSLRLRDRFTDHGLVGVALGRRQGDTCDIDLFLMSCRVIGRRAEESMIALLADEARRIGCAELRGRYVPTEKNGLVQDLYERLGFTRAEVGPNDVGGTRWRLDLATSAFRPSPFIRLDTGATVGTG